MPSRNPFAPPLAELELSEDENAERALASKKRRLAAHLVDAVVAYGASYPLVELAKGQSWLADYAESANPVKALALAQALNCLCFVVANFYPLMKRGQSLGKMLLTIRIVDDNGEIPPLHVSLGLREGPFILGSLVPLVGVPFYLIDSMFIFRKDRRCVHDLIAKTQVVQVIGD